MFSIADIESDHSIKRFITIKSGLKANTIKGYIYVIKEFCNFTGKNPTEICELHRQDLLNRTPEFDMWLNKALEGYVSYLIDKGLFSSTIRFHLVNIFSFYRAFKLKPLPEIDISLKSLKEDAKHALDIEDIRKAIRNSNPTYQTLFIVQAQTGLSVGDALLFDVEDFIKSVTKKGEKLTLKDALTKVKREKDIIGCMDLRRKKTTVEFYTFIGPEALKSIATLLESRNEDLLDPKIPIFIKDISKVRLDKEEAKSDLRLSPNAAMHI